MKWGHHFNWADWDESAKTDREGKYRIITSSAKGIAAKHPDYRENELEDSLWAFEPGHNVRKKIAWSQGEQRPEQKVGPDCFVLRLHPLMALHGRVVDVDGEPVPGVSATWCDSDSDAEGRFCVKVTREEWSQRDKGKISFYSEHHRSLDVPLKDFSLDRETVVTLEREQLIRGQVLDENGKPLEDCKIELKCESEHVRSDFYTVAGPYSQGKWEEHISEHDRLFTLRVSVQGSIRSLKQYTLEEVTSGPVITRLAEGRRLTARLVAQVPLDEKNTPVVFLNSTENEELRQRARVQPDGSIAFSGLADGKYTLVLYPSSCFQLP